jgi:glycosyltransferase involved in cell wall biosynthesis
LRQRYHLENPYILTVGARRPHKNLLNLVKAYAALSADFNHDLVFAGPPDRRFPDEAREAVARFDIQARVHFLDWVPEEDLPALYSQAELVVLPSLIEGFGLPALEAMASGTAVIAADNSSFPEVIDSAGLLVDPHDVDMIHHTMARLLADSSLRFSLSQAGKHRATHFTWDTAALHISQLYRSVLQETQNQISRLELPDS